MKSRRRNRGSQTENFKAILEARLQGMPQGPDYAYYPNTWVEPYKTRRKDCGYCLYHSLHIEKEDTVKREEAWNRNYTFFGAPVGLFFSVDFRWDMPMRGRP